jgi:hypothetical protein
MGHQSFSQFGPQRAYLGHPPILDFVIPGRVMDCDEKPHPPRRADRRLIWATGHVDHQSHLLVSSSTGCQAYEHHDCGDAYEIKNGA